MKRLFTLVVLFSVTSFAAEPVVCTLTTSTGSAASTAACTTGSNSWARGGAVLMQCTTDVYVSSTSTASSTVTPATSSSELVGFSANTDKVAIWLNPGDKDISVLAVTAAGTCKFMTTTRKRP